VFIERIEDKGLSQYSYVVACEGAGEAAVVDPRRDVDVYLELAAARDVRITHVLETHIHADFASGARELAQRTGAALSLSAYDQGETFDVTFPHCELHDGDAIALGGVTLRALHTPGHTPEHVSFLVFDRGRAADVPMVMLSGDFVFVGSLGRPDLLGEDAKRGLARQLYRSVREKLHGLPDGLEIAPGHGAGSMCGAGMSGRAVSTLGFERIANPYLSATLTEDAFVDRILANVPPFPAYYRRMKRLNSQGPALLHGVPGRDALPVAAFHALVEAGYVVIDLRDQLGFGAGHIPGSFGIGGTTSLSTWASWVVPYDKPILLVGQGETQIDEAIRALVRVGLDDVRGFLQGGIDAWIRAGHPLAQTPQITPAALARRLMSSRDALQVVDVRTDSEWTAGHIAGARNLMAGFLADRVDELRELDGTIALVCASGYRSTVSASVLERAGITNLLHVTGGMNAWQQAGLPVETPAAHAVGAS
jgi:hydroxyacylglutathione hydrolase